MKELILSEKYRPQTVDECILPASTKDIANGIIASGNVPSMLFVGSAGCGKTTMARAIARELNADILFINASMEGNVDLIRTKLTQFASSVSFSGARKITVLDEADGLTQAAQQALRGFIEEFGANHSIIFTANFENKIIEAIHSRCKVINFKVHAAEKTELMTQFSKRVFDILKAENIEFDRTSVVHLVKQKFPDFRSVLNELQGYSAGGKIDSGILMSLSHETFNQLIAHLKAKKFKEVRKWVGENSDIESTDMFRLFYDTASEKIEPSSEPELILHLAEFGHRDYFAVDKEINRMAFLVTIMTSQSIVWR